MVYTQVNIKLRIKFSPTICVARRTYGKEHIKSLHWGVIIPYVVSTVDTAVFCVVLLRMQIISSKDIKRQPNGFHKSVNVWQNWYSQAEVS